MPCYSCGCGPGKEVSIIIEDEGQGFDTTAVSYPAVVESRNPTISEEFS